MPPTASGSDQINKPVAWMFSQLFLVNTDSDSFSFNNWIYLSSFYVAAQPQH